jgi:hypothetical protein
MERRRLLAAHVAGSSVVYTTIQAAVNAAPVGGTVTVDAGTYAEEVTVTTASLTILGAQAGIDGRTASRKAATGATESLVTGAVAGSVHSAAFHVLANDVTIDGFTVAGETSQDELLGAGIVIGPGRSGTHVTDDVIRNNVAGLFLANASATDPALIQHDYFGNNNNPGVNGGRGIYTDQSISGGTLTNVTIDADTFANNYGSTGTTTLEAGVAFEASSTGHQSNVRITNSAFSGNGKAVLFFNTAGILIQGNTVTYCLDHYSGSLRFEGGDTNVTIQYNNVNHNTGPGVAIDSKGTPYDNSGFVVHFNDFATNSTAYAVPMSVVVDYDTYDGTLDARYNDWNAPSGPSGQGPGTGDAVGSGHYTAGTVGWQLTDGGAVLYAPFATAPIAVPGAPTGLNAAAASATQVNLTWVAPASQPAYSGTLAYAVDRSTDGGTTWTTVATPSTAAYADTGLTAGTKYTYRVRATNGFGTSAGSNLTSATTAAGVTTPTATRLAGTLIGTAGSYANAGNTIAKAVDGSLATYLDGPTANGNWVGLDLGSAATITQLAFAPRSGWAARMVGGVFQASTSADFTTGVTTLYTVTATPVVGSLTTVALSAAASARYVRYLSPAGSYGNVAEVDFYGTTTATTVTARTGTVIGTAGSYTNGGNTIAKAVDGSLTTFFDGPTANGNWVGLDLGSAKSISQISYAPRSGWAARMVGGVFQASTTADFSAGVTTLYTISAAPVVGSLTTVTLSTPVTARYVRYLSPAGSYGDVAEIAFAG